MNEQPIDIVHFSDVLCIWAYISQVRVQELQEKFPEETHLDYRFLQVFGDVAGKMATQWSDRGGLSGYAAHVQEVAAQFDHIQLHPKIWIEEVPTSSLPAHLVLCGVKALHRADPDGVEPGQVERVLKAMRHAFFVELTDISNRHHLLEIAERAGVDVTKLERALDSGLAHARLSADLVAATENAVRASPTMILDGGRQVLAGNVGYRVLEANIRELLRSPADQRSWC